MRTILSNRKVHDNIVYVIILYFLDLVPFSFHQFATNHRPCKISLTHLLFCSYIDSCVRTEICSLIHSTVISKRKKCS